MNDFKIKNLIFKYDDSDKLVLKNINLNIYDGEFLCVLGKSGCGKSTLLKLLSGLIFPTSGEILFNDEIIKGASLNRGVVFQDYGLFPWMTVGDNLLIALKQKYKEKKKQELKDIAIEYIKKVGLDTNVYKTLPNKLSGGMKQRIAIAQALSVDPNVLLMDEPFGALDAVTRAKLQDLVIDLVKKNENKKTVVFITHDVDEALLLADRIIVLGQSPSEIIFDKTLDKDEKMIRGESVLNKDVNSYV